MLIKENEIPRVALNDMNEVHDVEIEIVNKLYNAIVENEDIAEILKYFNEFLNDIINHFTFEQGLMEKYNFFAYPIHRTEHDRVMYELKSLEKMLKEKGDIKTVKDYLENVFKPWIINHVQTMDTVTAIYLSNFV
jgi:hemerythrin